MCYLQIIYDLDEVFGIPQKAGRRAQILLLLSSYLVDYFAYYDQRIASFVAVVVNFVGHDSSS